MVDVDASPDLGNARVKVSILGDRKAKISAMRWLNSNVRAGTPPCEPTIARCHETFCVVPYPGHR